MADPITISVNGTSHTLSLAPETPLLYVLRNDLELNGAKFGCGLAQCGACTVIADGAPIRSCVTQLPGSLEKNRRLDAWIRIDPEGTVTVFTGKVELGQGAVTALAQIAADELDVGFSRIRMVSGDTARTPNEGFTSGSQSMELGGTALKHAAAEARSI